MAFDIESLKQRLVPVTSVPVTGNQGRPKAAVAVILNATLKGGSALLIQRTERAKDPWSGQIAFPGGHKSENDRTSLDTAIREAFEEVGIDLRPEELLGGLPLVYSRTRRVLVAPVVFRLMHDASVRLNQEVATSFWVPLDALSGMRAIRRKVQDEGRRITADSYAYGGHVIWGLTFRIINELFNKKNDELLNRSEPSI